jgi:hypothetical protein
VRKIPLSPGRPRIDACEQSLVEISDSLPRPLTGNPQLSPVLPGASTGCAKERADHETSSGPNAQLTVSEMRAPRRIWRRVSRMPPCALQLRRRTIRLLSRRPRVGAVSEVVQVFPRRRWLANYPASHRLLEKLYTAKRAVLMMRVSMWQPCST